MGTVLGDHTRALSGSTASSYLGLLPLASSTWPPTSAWLSLCAGDLTHSYQLSHGSSGPAIFLPKSSPAALVSFSSSDQDRALNTQTRQALGVLTSVSCCPGAQCSCEDISAPLKHFLCLAHTM